MYADDVVHAAEIKVSLLDKGQKVNGGKSNGW